MAGGGQSGQEQMLFTGEAVLPLIVLLVKQHTSSLLTDSHTTKSGSTWEKIILYMLSDTYHIFAAPC